MSQPLLTILIPTIGRRYPRFRRLAIEILSQAETRGGVVRVLVYYNNGERPLGHIRQALVEAATGTYISFVDDDDWVPDYYVDRVLEAVFADAAPLGGPDYVGWRMQHYADSHPSKPTYHSLAYGGWYENSEGYYRDVSHLNPVRRELAVQADFRRGDPPEDVAWSVQMRRLLKTEVVIDPEYVMYHYFSSGDSTWRPGSVRPDPSLSRPQIEHPFFDWHPESSP